MKRIAFLTDLHFDVGSRWDETLRIADWCVDKLQEEKPDAIAIGGDVFERKPVPTETRAVAEWFIRLAEIAPVVGVYGNHDVPESLAVMNRLESVHPIHIADRPELHQVAGVEFALLPWPLKARLLALLGDVGKEQAREIGAEMLLNVVRGLGLSEWTGPRCLVGHVQIRGARVSTGQPLVAGADFELGTEDLALARCHAYLLGHVHLGQEYVVNGADTPMLYGGSFRRTAYGEIEEKHIVLLEMGDGGGSSAVQYIPIPCAPMLLLEAEWDGGGLPLHLPSDAEGRARAVCGAEIRLRFSFPADHREAAKAAAENARDGLLADGAAAVKLEPLTLTTSTARAPEVAKARTLADKLAALWAARETTPEPPRAARLIDYAHDLEKAS